MADYRGSQPQQEKATADVRNQAFDGYGFRELSGHRKKVMAVAWNCEGKRLATGALDKSIRIWTPEPCCSVSKSERSDAEYSSHTDAVTFIQWRADHPDVLASISASKLDNNVRFHDARTNKQVAAVSLNQDKNTSLTWAPDGNTLCVVTSSGDLVFVDTRKMKRGRQWSGHSDVITEVKYGPTPGHLTMGTEDGDIRIVSTSKLDHPLWKLRTNMNVVACLAYSFNNKYLASGGYDGLVSLWDMDDVICLRTFARADQSVRAVSFSNDARWLAYSSEDNSGTINVVSTHTGELAATLNLRTMPDAVAWSPTAPVLAFGGEEYKDSATVVLWAPPRAA